MADIFPGAVVVEAGVGSGALSMSLLRAVGESGRLHSFERREDFADIAMANARAFFGTDHPAWTVTVGDLVEALPAAVAPGIVDRVVLDMLAPWECLEVVAEALAPGGRPHLLRRHGDPAVEGRRGDARRGGVDRAVGVGVARARAGTSRASPSAPSTGCTATPASSSPPAGWPPGVTPPLRKRRPGEGYVSGEEALERGVDPGGHRRTGPVGEARAQGSPFGDGHLPRHS